MQESIYRSDVTYKPIFIPNWVRFLVIINYDVSMTFQNVVVMLLILAQIKKRVGSS